MEPYSYRRAAYSNLRGQVALCGKAIARTELATLDQLSDVRDDLLRASFKRFGHYHSRRIAVRNERAPDWSKSLLSLTPLITPTVAAFEIVTAGLPKLGW